MDHTWRGCRPVMWLWMTAIAVLVGAELNSEIDVAAGLIDEGPH